MAQELENIIEALLFTTDKPLDASVLASAADTGAKDVEEAIGRINARFSQSGSPISIRQVAGGYEFLTLPQYARYIKKLYKSRYMARLSRPAMEVLAIIAYKQPITKQEVELIRGVNSDGVYYTLLERKLVRIAGRKDSPGRPLLYGTTREFLQYLGINSLEDLPKLEEIKSILEMNENIENWESKVEAAKDQARFDFSDTEGKSVEQRLNEEKEEGTMREELATGESSAAAEDEYGGRKRGGFEDEEEEGVYKDEEEDDIEEYGYSEEAGEDDFEEGAEGEKKLKKEEEDEDEDEDDEEDIFDDYDDEDDEDDEEDEEKDD